MVPTIKLILTNLDIFKNYLFILKSFRKGEWEREIFHLVSLPQMSAMSRAGPGWCWEPEIPSSFLTWVAFGHAVFSNPLLLSQVHYQEAESKVEQLGLNWHMRNTGVSGSSLTCCATGSFLIWTFINQVYKNLDRTFSLALPEKTENDLRCLFLRQRVQLWGHWNPTIPLAGM